MIRLTYYITGLLVFAACLQLKCQESSVQTQEESTPVHVPQIPEHTTRYGGITILTTGPRGGGYTDPQGTALGYRVFRIQVFNDTIIPIELALRFVPAPVPLLPDSAVTLTVYLFPDTLTPDTIQDDLDFGVTGIQEFLDSEITTPSILHTSIQPNEQHILYVGILLHTVASSGRARSQLLFDGPEIDVPFLPVTSAKTQTRNSSSIDLVYGIAVGPPTHYALIPCGQIHYMK